MKKEHGLWLISSLALVGSIMGIVFSFNPIAQGATKSSIDAELVTKIETIETLVRNNQLETKELFLDTQACVFPSKSDVTKIKERDNQKSIIEENYLDARLDLEIAMIDTDMRAIEEKISLVDNVKLELENHIAKSNLDGEKFPHVVGAGLQAIESSPSIIPCGMAKEDNGKVKNIDEIIEINPIHKEKLDRIRLELGNKGELNIELRIKNIKEEIVREVNSLYTEKIALLETVEVLKK